MNLTVKPTDSLKGSVALPSSKSYTIRAFIIASCGGVSQIINPTFSDDALVALRTARALGAKISRRNKNAWHMTAFPEKTLPRVINVRESGTVLRFLLALAAFKAKAVKITGTGTLQNRPNIHLIRVLRKMGAEISGRGKGESVPVVVKKGKLRGGKITVDGNLSSQFISSLLIACPQLSEDTALTVVGRRFVSQDYVIMTQQILKKTGVDVRRKSPRQFLIKGSQRFKGLKNFLVPSDYGLAAFFLAAASLVNSDISLKGAYDDDLIQADEQILPLLKKMGVRFAKTRESIRLRGPFRLKGGSFSLKDCPDLVPIMAIVALFAEGKTRLYDIAHVRVKESDRISDLRKELLKIGADVREKQNELVIYPKKRYKRNALLDPHRDHRLAMAFCVLGLKVGARIKNIECMRKSYPAFAKDFKGLGAAIR